MCVTSLYKSLEHYIFRALTLYQAGGIQDVFKIELRLITVLALGWTPRSNINGLHLSPKCFDSGKGHPCTLNARRPLHSIDMWHRVDKPPHQAKITTRNRFSRPQMDYDILHGSAGYPMQLGPLGHLFIQQQRALRRAKLRPEKLLRCIPLLRLVNCAASEELFGKSKELSGELHTWLS